MKVSIITINLNNLDGLQKTIDSVICQTSKDFEWIIIDGGSTDGSVELIEKYAKHITYWVSEPDTGIYNAMNKGIKVSKGEYLMFLNSGDYLANNTILADVLKNITGEDIVYGFLKMSKDDRIVNCLSKEDITLLDLWHNIIPHQSSFFKSSLFDRFGFYDETLHIVADWVFYSNAIICGNCSVKFLPIVISIYEGGGISSNFKECNKETLEVINRLSPKVYCTIKDALSKQEICHNRFFSILYSILYRVAIIFR